MKIRLTAILAITPFLATASAQTIDFEGVSDFAQSTITFTNVGGSGVEVMFSSSDGLGLSIFDTTPPISGVNNDDDLMTPGSGSGNQSSVWQSSPFGLLYPDNPPDTPADTYGAGNVLVIQEDATSGGRNLVPNDHAGGGTIKVTFSEAVNFTGFGFIDVEPTENDFQLIIDGGVGIPFLGLGNNSYVEDTSLSYLVSESVEFDFKGSGAISGIRFSVVPEPAAILGSLFGLGVIGIAGLRRRRAANALLVRKG